MRNSRRFKELAEKYGLDFACYSVGSRHYVKLDLSPTSLDRVISILLSLTDNRVVLRNHRGPTRAFILLSVTDLNELKKEVIEDMVVALALEEVM